MTIKDKDLFLQCENNYNPSKIEKVTGSLYGGGQCTVNLNGQQIFTLEDCMSTLGENYLEYEKYTKEILYLNLTKKLFLLV